MEGEQNIDDLLQEALEFKFDDLGELEDLES